MALSPTAASAPGKVLLAGGYLVLDRAYTGLVFGLDARIHVHVQALPTTPGVTLSEVIVKSPQFKGALWEYSYRQTEDDGGISITQLRAGASQHISRNVFIETALSFALTYVSQGHQARLEPASITILADDDYYSSTADPQARGNERHIGNFANFGTTLGETHKTGLGSSAALVTAFTAAVLIHYLPEGKLLVATDSGKATLHNLAQAAHCAAQGKVGSGFDVASAVYGSCLYRRFSPSLLESYGEPGAPGFGKRLRDLVENVDPQRQWDADVMKSKVAVPKGIRLVMLDVDCGSQTPGMVKQVLAWRKENPKDADTLWGQLQKANEDFAAELVRLGKSSDTGNYGILRNCVLTIRTLIRDMSQRSGVPIEPQPQTALLDECSALPGVIGGVVPGAGGYDAVALLVEDRQEVIDGLHGYLAQRHLATSQQGKQSVGKVTILSVREEMQGVRIEDVSRYQEWLR